MMPVVLLKKNKRDFVKVATDDLEGSSDLRPAAAL